MTHATYKSIKDVKNHLIAGMISKKRNGNFLARWSYFYRMGKTEETYVHKVKSVLPGVNIVDSGDHWAAFKGGATLQNQSHFWVEFNFDESELIKETINRR